MLIEIIITTILRGIPEAFIHMYAMFALANVKIDKKKYTLSSFVLAFLMVLISYLPISYGIHSILVVMVIIGLGVMVNQFDTVYCISVAIINMIIQFLTEGINVLLIEKVLKMDLAKAMSNPLGKSIYGIPSLIMFFGIIFIAHRVIRKRRGKQNDQYTKFM